MPDQVTELLIAEKALDKLGARNISADEVEQLLRNTHLIVRNPQAPDPGTRRLLAGPRPRSSVSFSMDRSMSQSPWEHLEPQPG